MKKNYLITLSALAITAMCGLASCSGQGHPTEKVDVYLRAQGATLAQEMDSKGVPITVTKPVDFKDDECITMTVDNKETLKYGQQDVVITLEPKPGFTLREYELFDASGNDSWLPKGAPVHPYVGLGNPHSLYNYPLQEGVAWTFEDLSTKEGTTGFYHEKYKVTVDKKFFQKNLVIDFGNTAKNNFALTYTSNHYLELFKNAIFKVHPELGNWYELDEDYSSFLAGSDGITATYRLKADNELFTFDKWRVDPHMDTNSDAEVAYYDNFEIKGQKSTYSPVILSAFEKGKEREEQAFIPSIISKKISFFIKWDKLMKGMADKYAPLYDDISVDLIKPECIDPAATFDPTPSKTVEVSYEIDSSSTSLITDLSDPIGKGYAQGVIDEESGQWALGTLSTVTVGSSNLGSGNGGIFNRCDVVQPNSITGKPAVDTTYGILFKVDQSVKTINFEFTAFTADKEEIHNRNANLDGQDGSVTGWRADVVEEEKVTKEGYYSKYDETELIHWDYDIDWYLVELNPKPNGEREIGDRSQSSGALPDGWGVSGDTFYLYADGMEPFIKNSETGAMYSSYKISISASAE